jgi:hypothetical protein
MQEESFVEGESSGDLLSSGGGWAGRKEAEGGRSKKHKTKVEQGYKT